MELQDTSFQYTYLVWVNRYRAIFLDGERRPGAKSKKLRTMEEKA